MVRLDCQIRLRYESTGPATYLVNVLPARTPQQRVLAESLQVHGAHGPVRVEPDRDDTRFARFEGEGPIEVASRFSVSIDHVCPPRDGLAEPRPSSVSPQAWPFMLPSRYCESDRLLPFAREQFGWMTPGYDRVLAIADWVRENVAFEVGTTQWQTSAADVLASRRGVCRDFAHVTIAILRALNVPARFVTGVDYGADPALGPVDFHAYVEALLGDRWYLFDPTGISPTTGLLRLGTGRDAADVSFATIYGDVRWWAPSLQIDARHDPEHGILLPQRTREPVSTAALLAGAGGGYGGIERRQPWLAGLVPVPSSILSAQPVPRGVMPCPTPAAATAAASASRSMASPRA